MTPIGGSGSLINTRAGIVPGLLLGFGLGGFVDGILLHQLLQWHHMVSAEGCCPTNSLVGLEENTTADGFFHLVTWLVTLIGSLTAIKAWREGRLAPPWRAHVGALIAGWGIFNVVDSANHFVLGLHHIRDDLGGPVEWDIGFLVLALAQLGVGWALIRSGPQRRPDFGRATAMHRG